MEWLGEGKNPRMAAKKLNENFTFLILQDTQYQRPNVQYGWIMGRIQFVPKEWNIKGPKNVQKMDNIILGLYINWRNTLTH